MKAIYGLSLFTVLASQVALANNVYVGAGIGGIGLETKLTSDVTLTQGGTSTETTYNSHNFDKAFNSSLVLGYAMRFPNQTFLALEGFANYPESLETHNALSTANGTLSSSLKYHSVYGVRLLPGMQLSPKADVYGIVGYALANVNVQNSTVGMVTDAQLYNNSSDDNQSLNGYQLGLGAMTHVSDHVLLRGDAIYTGYQQTKQVTSTSTNGVLSNAYRQTPYTLEANVAVIYQFGD